MYSIDSLTQLYGYTFEEVKKKHKELWGWLARTGANIKNIIAYESVEEFDYCYAEFCSDCERILLGHTATAFSEIWECPFLEIGYVAKCSECSIRERVNAKVPIESVNNIYSEWRAANNLADRKKLAAIIRDLPWPAPYNTEEGDTER